MMAVTTHYPDGIKTVELAPGEEPIQHTKLEWGEDEGVRIVMARIYKGTKRTSAYIPIPKGDWDGNCTLADYSKAQDMYRADN